jgi:hypothetical protein
MSISVALERPDVLGSIDPNLLSLLKNEGCDLPAGFGVDDTAIGLLPLYRELASISGISLIANQKLLGRSSRVFSGEVQDNKSRRWHTDNSKGCLVADAIPTQILTGDDEIIRNFWNKKLRDNFNGSIEAYAGRALVAAITSQVELLGDAVLTSIYGFTIWSPDPLSVISLKPTDIHRSQENISSGSVSRNYAMIYHNAW